MDYNFKTHQYRSFKMGSDASKWDLSYLTFRLELFKEIWLTHCIKCEKKWTNNVHSPCYLQLLPYFITTSNEASFSQQVVKE